MHVPDSTMMLCAAVPGVMHEGLPCLPAPPQHAVFEDHTGMRLYGIKKAPGMQCLAANLPRMCSVLIQQYACRMRVLCHAGQHPLSMQCFNTTLAHFCNALQQR